MIEININTDFIKLDQLLKFAGLAESGAFAKLLIKNEEVAVNNVICTQRGKKIYPKDIVEVEGYDKILVKSEKK